MATVVVKKVNILAILAKKNRKKFCNYKNSIYICTPKTGKAQVVELVDTLL